MADADALMYANGEFVSEAEATISPLDRGFTLADGLFETMVAAGVRVFRIEDHLARMRRGADLLQLPMPVAEELAAIVEECLRCRGLPLSVVRLTLSRGVDTGRGLNAPAALDPSVVVRVTPWAGPSATSPAGRTLMTSSLARNDRSPLSRVKALAYVDGVVARLEAQRAGADDALMCNTRGLVAGATSSNIFAVISGVLVTPPVADGALPGISRLTLLEEASRLGVACEERSLTAEEVAAADEALLSNVVQGPLPVASVDGTGLRGGAPGALTWRLFEAYWARVRWEVGG
ncbi:MAG: aminotransferase class IV [Chloroflexota bacterium]|nr:aminotransferase class IV [Chloroflexota bacterium]MDE2941087.1 aminotransferase class IV [Chloroflexota bacterium]MDE3267387.1 aminotransferase class IV [Chloroflexota bacterium]